jgi:D,D-heptose 1,7-bisphosphate phosphatase
MKLDAVILCGGYGTRIKKYTQNKIPKSLIKINNRPFLDYLIKKICKYPFNKIIIITGFKGKEISKLYNNKKINLIDIECVVEEKPMGTGYALNSIKDKIKNDFVLFNGDTFLDYNLQNFFNRKLKRNYIAKIILTRNKKKSLTKNLLNMNLSKKNLIYFSKKSSLINSGTILFSKKIRKYINKKYFSLENDILKKLITNNKIVGEICNSFFVDIGTEKNLKYARKELPKLYYKPALFLDRDGVINKDLGHVCTKNKLFFNKDVIKKIIKLQKNKYFVFIVTNQAGVAKGFFSLHKFYKFQKFIHNYLCEQGLFVNDVQFCPHHPEEKIKNSNCKCRKPKNGMIKNLQKKWDIDIKNSLFIGDKKTDKDCAERSNIKFLFCKNNELILNKNIN